MSHGIGFALRGRTLAAVGAAALVAGAPVVGAFAQAPAAPATASVAPLSSAALQDLVGPIALYPDDLIGIVLPASTYPLQVVQAKRFLDDRAKNPELKANPNWDDSVVALLNYPEVVKLMNNDLDWTAQLGDAVVDQRADVLDAIQSFRDRADAAGNLKSDDRQVVKHEDDGSIAIAPADPEVIYVPYYEPQRVVVYQAVPVYHYYPLAYPVYYYPYPAGYAFDRFDSGFFWGVTTAFVIGWHSHVLHVERGGYIGHPYYGRSYYDPFYVRNDIHVNINVSRNRQGDVWEPQHRVPGHPYWSSSEHRVGGDRNDGHRDGDFRPRHRDDAGAAPRQDSRGTNRTVEQRPQVTPPQQATAPRAGGSAGAQEDQRGSPQDRAPVSRNRPAGNNAPVSRNRPAEKNDQANKSPRTDTRQAPAKPDDTSSRFNSSGAVVGSPGNRPLQTADRARIYRQQQQQQSANGARRDAAPPPATPRVSVAPPPAQAQSNRPGYRPAERVDRSNSGGVTGQRAQVAPPPPRAQAESLRNDDRGSRDASPPPRAQRDDGNRGGAERQGRGGGDRGRDHDDR